MPQIPEYIRATSMVFCIIIMCLGVIGNIMVPIVILKTKDMRNSTNIFLTNLSIADILVLLVCTPTVLVEVNSPPEVWVLGEEMCKAVPFVELTVAHASVLTILAISFERYYAICEPLKAGYVCTKARALMICLAAWAVAAILTSPILLISSYEHVEYFNGKIVASCLTPVENMWHVSFFVGSIVVFFVVPLLVLVVLYSVISKNLMDNPGIIMSSASGTRNHVIKYRKQVIFMLGAVVVSFFFCLLPFRALTLWIIIVPSENIIAIGFERFYIILYFCRIMLYMNSAINPILYNLMSSKFRNGFLQLLGCGKMIRSDSISSSARKGTYHTGSMNSSSHNSSSQRRLTREGSCVTARVIAENSSRKRLLHQRHSSTISTRSSHDEPSGAGGNGNEGPISTDTGTYETTPLKADKIDEIDETINPLPNGFNNFKRVVGGNSCNVSFKASNNCNNKTSQRMNGTVSVEPKAVHQTDNKHLIVRAAVIVMREVTDEDEKSTSLAATLPVPEQNPTDSEVTLIQGARGSEQIVSIITAKERANGNCFNKAQQNDTSSKAKKGEEGEVAFDEITKIRHFYGSKECDI
ncbi:QRFP-like peptide receptor [Armigeres subalbatus]|uniref:QRFP-like peptide receptor n=1 Tax=Armigeres subalbatus TaxID=124917 RepID=UPI002ED557E8